MQEKPNMPHFKLLNTATGDVISSPSWDELLSHAQAIDMLSAAQDIQRVDGPSPGLAPPLWWLDVRDAKKMDVASVAQTLSIHPLTAEDVVVQEPREKVEVFRNYYLISLQTLLDFNAEAIVPSSAPFFILVFQNSVVTFSASPCPHVDAVHRRIHKMHNPSILSSDWIGYALIDNIIDSFEPSSRAAEHESDAIEDQVFISRFDDLHALLPRIEALRRKITHIARCLLRQSRRAQRPRQALRVPARRPHLPRRRVSALSG
ncbi:hypothetical protein N7470_006563 [Penicillium chermesinum]|nr:hypothetical protein N7470_006563 [Penicillium chermesinum]